ncbi:MAG: hypothetical protein V4723_18940 [Pseudomonadota bacterium]
MKNLQQQQGLTLIMALIMLIVITLLALTSFNLGKSNLLVVSNMQQREEAGAAAREVIEEVISSNRFTQASNSALISPCNGVANSRCIDTNGDGSADVTVQLTPKPGCVKAKVIRNSEIDVTNDEERECLLGASANTGIEGASTGASMCSNSVWEVTAVATDNRTESKVTVVQGVAVKVPTDDVQSNCS